MNGLVQVKMSLYLSQNVIRKCIICKAKIDQKDLQLFFVYSRMCKTFNLQINKKFESKESAKLRYQNDINIHNASIFVSLKIH